LEAVAQSSGRARALHALRSRDFRLLWAGQTISLVGDGAFLVALGWKSFSLTGSKSTLALVLMAHGTAMLATLLIGGALADRYPRRTLMIIGVGLGVWNTLMMQFVPESKLARVSSLDFFGSFALVPVGYALTAIVAGLFAPSTLLIAGFTLSAFLWTAPLALRRVREAA